MARASTANPLTHAHVRTYAVANVSENDVWQSCVCRYADALASGKQYSNGLAGFLQATRLKGRPMALPGWSGTQDEQHLDLYTEVCTCTGWFFAFTCVFVCFLAFTCPLS